MAAKKKSPALPGQRWLKQVVEGLNMVTEGYADLRKKYPEEVPRPIVYQLDGNSLSCHFSEYRDGRWHAGKINAGMSRFYVTGFRGGKTGIIVIGDVTDNAGLIHHENAEIRMRDFRASMTLHEDRAGRAIGLNTRNDLEGMMITGHDAVIRAESESATNFQKLLGRVKESFAEFERFMGAERQPVVEARDLMGEYDDAGAW